VTARRNILRKNIYRGKRNGTGLFLIFFLAFFLYLDVASGAEIETKSIHWDFAGWYGGGFYPNVTFDPNKEGRIYLLSDVAGIWKSDNLGEEWIYCNQGLDNLIVSFLEVAPSDSNILYAGTAKGLYLSRNQGKNWEMCGDKSGKISFSRPDNYRSLDISRKNPGVVVIGTKRGRIYSSSDFGLHWKVLRRPQGFSRGDMPASTLQFDMDEKGLYSALGSKFYYYSFENHSWKLLKKSSKKITDFFITKERKPVIYLAGEKALFISKDGGKNWVLSSPIAKGRIFRVVVSNSEQGKTIYVVWNKGWHGGIYVSIDGGKTWRGTSSDIKFDKELNPTRLWANGEDRFVSLKINPFDSQILFTTSAWGVFRSNDGGFHWQEKINGAPNSVGSDIHIASTGEIYVATMDNGLLKSTNGGKTYQALFPSRGYRKDTNGHVWRVTSNPQNPNILIGTSSPWGERINQVIISQDGGLNFKLVQSGLPDRRPKVNTMWEEGYPRAVAFDPQNPSTVYLGIDGDDGGGLFISRDSGWHWQPSKGQPHSRRIYNALAVDPKEHRRIFWGAYGEEGGLYISEDSGNSWKKVFSQMKKIFDLEVSPEGWIYLAGDFDGPAVFISKNAGGNWSLLKRFPGEGTAEALFIHPENPKKMAVSTVRWNGDAHGKIYSSFDGGETWCDITGDLPPGAGAAAMDYNVKDSSLYIIRYAASVYKTKF